MEMSSGYILFPPDPHKSDSLVSDDTEFDPDNFLDLDFFGVPEPLSPGLTLDPEIISRRDITQSPSLIYNPDISTATSCQESFPAALITTAAILSSQPQKIINQSDLTQSSLSKDTPVISTAACSQDSFPVTIATTTAAVLSSPSQKKITSRAHQESENTESSRPKSPSQKAKRKNTNSYKCPECPYETSRLKHLGDHMRDIHEIKAFKCDNCETRVARYDNLESHKRSCGALPAASSLAASVADSSITARPAKRQRVSLRNLQPVPLRTLPQPTSPYESERVGSTTPSLSQNEILNTQPQRHETAQLSNEASETTLAFNVSSTKTAAELALEVASLKFELAKARKELQHTVIERDVWKVQYVQLQLKQEAPCM